MLGIKVRLFKPLTNVSLEDLVPKNHFYRHIEDSLDLSFVREMVKDCYAPIGRPSVDPVVFFKLQLVMFFEGIRSERLLMRHAADRLSIRWYLGYDLCEPLPDHSSLTRIRERYGLEVFRRFFDEIVERCVEAGLVWGEELYSDATKVEANASLDSVAPRFAVEAHVAELFAGVTAGASAPSDDTSIPEPLPIPMPAAEREELASSSGERHEWIAQEGRQDRDAKHGHYQRTSDYRASYTDPDATLMPLKDGVHLGYHDHYVVDGGKARIILQALVTPSEVMENQPALDLLWRCRFRWKLWPQQVTGDTKYGTIENIAALEQEGIRAYTPLSDFDARTPFFGQRDFRYDPRSDSYTCPAGQTLPLWTRKPSERTIRYRADAATCNACPLKPRCTTSDHGRQVCRSFDEEYLERVRGYHETESYKKARRKRQVWVEPLFGEGKQWHGLGRFRLRRLRRVNIEAQLIATGQNLKRLLSWRGWGKTHFPGGATQVAVAPFPL